jgi:hypothetical protein
MRLSTLVVPLSALGLLAGCSHSEKVVERDRPVVEKQTVIERPVPAAGATVAPACAYGGVAYSDGALSCQNNQQFRCSNGAWNRTLGSC